MAEPRTQHDYGVRAIAAARRVLIDLGQVLGSYFDDSIIVVGGWVPDLLLAGADEPHIGSMDIDLALDAEKLGDGRYAEIVKSLLATGRYSKTESAFKLRAQVDLDDGGPVLFVDVDFLKAPERRRSRKSRRLLEDFRPLDADGCSAAFREPTCLKLEGRTISGADNSVRVLVAALEDFILMKSYALAKRDKPKDAYDLCYCLANAPDGMVPLASSWRRRRDDPLVRDAIGFLREKFASVEAYGPQQVVIFYDVVGEEERELHARRAFELVARFLSLVG